MIEAGSAAIFSDLAPNAKAQRSRGVLRGAQSRPFIAKRAPGTGMGSAGGRGARRSFEGIHGAEMKACAARGSNDTR